MFIFTVVGSLLFQPLVSSGGALKTQLLRHDVKSEAMMILKASVLVIGLVGAVLSGEIM